MRLLLSFFRMVFRRNTPEEDDEFRRDVLGEYTRAELLQMGHEERAWYNKNMAGMVFHAGGTQYQDADGNWRDVSDA